MDGKADEHATDEALWNIRHEEINNTTEKDLWKSDQQRDP